jgi:class 3 adenylate cyclase/tetratricopeptide (TPR) repeat protein
VQVCPNCGEENPDRFRLCGFCGTKLAPEIELEDVRKTVTIVFSDLKGSTSLGESLDTESLREVLNLYFQEMQAALERHGGTVEKFIGDAVMAVFGLPRLHEDDALRAVRAAADMKEGLATLNQRLEASYGVRLENRTGVNTGEVVAGDATQGQRLVTGDAVNTAARLEQAAPALEVLIGEPTYRLVKGSVKVEPVEPLSLKGKAQPVPAYRLISVHPGEAFIRHLDAPIVGRVRELSVLEEALASSEADRSCRLVTVFGPAGVGKSRLLEEFLIRSSERAQTVRGRCLPYGDGITYWPLGEVIREAAGIMSSDSLDVARSKLLALVSDENIDVADRLGAAIGFSTAAFPAEEIFWAARRLFEILSRRRPLVVRIDDLHWAEPTFLELLRHVVDSAVDAPVALVCSSRRDLVEDHPDWGEERSNARVMTLEPLTEGESELVIMNLLGTADLEEEVRKRVIEAADGNPLFVEQMLSMLIDDGLLRMDDEGRCVFTSDLGSFTIPPSITALLSARLDRLATDERAVIERGSVIGQIFFRGAVHALVPEPVRDHVGPNLLSLTKKDLIRPADPSLSFFGQDAFRFGHILIRDSAYHGLLKRTRADLHERFVDWLEQIASDRVTEFEELRGYHLEQAYLILTQLGPVDDHAREVGGRGSRYLSSAGHRALAHGDVPAAGSLLQRAAALLPADDPERARLQLAAGEALIELGEFSIADAMLTSAMEGATALSDRGLETTARLVRVHLHYMTEAEGGEARIIEEAERAIPVLEEIGDHSGLARAWRLLTDAHGTAARFGAAEEAARHTIRHASIAGDRSMEARTLLTLSSFALWGPAPVPEALVRCHEVLERVAHDRRAEATTLGIVAHLEAMQGNFELARDLYRRSRAQLEEFGWKFYAHLTSLESGYVEMLAGDPIAAEAELRKDYLALEQMGERNYTATTAGMLAEALFEQGRLDEAEEFTATSEDVAAPDDIASQLYWRSVRGKILARRGRLEEGEDLVREAVAIIDRSDVPVAQGNARMDLAEVLMLAGKREAAAQALGDALDLFERKGNVVSARKAKAALEQVLVSSAPRSGGADPIPTG